MPHPQFDTNEMNSTQSSFILSFRNSCIKFNVCSKRWIKKLQRGNELNADLNKLSTSVIPPLVEALSNDRQLQVIKIVSFSRNPRLGGIPLNRHTNEVKKGIISQICLSVRKVMSNNVHLRSLQLIAFDLHSQDVDILCKGFCKSHLKHLSFQSTSLEDKDVEKICQSLKHTKELRHLIFNNCGLSTSASKIISNLIEAHSMRQRAALWKEGLRFHCPNLESANGIERVTLNNNPNICDAGALHWVDALTDDLWVKAVDMQNCGITNVGAKALSRLLHHNKILQVLDIRSNSIDEQILRQLCTELIQRHALRSSLMDNMYEYKWVPPLELEESKTETSCAAESNLTPKESVTEQANSDLHREPHIEVTVKHASIQTEKLQLSFKSTSAQTTDIDEFRSNLFIQENCLLVKEDVSIPSSSISAAASSHPVGDDFEVGSKTEMSTSKENISDDPQAEETTMDVGVIEMSSDEKFSPDAHGATTYKNKSSLKRYILVPCDLLKGFITVAKLVEQSHGQISKMSMSSSFSHISPSVLWQLKDSVYMCKFKLRSIEDLQQVDGLHEIELKKDANVTILSLETLLRWKQHIEKIEGLFCN